MVEDPQRRPHDDDLTRKAPSDEPELPAGDWPLEEVPNDEPRRQGGGPLIVIVALVLALALTWLAYSLYVSNQAPPDLGPPPQTAAAKP
ncbi:MAG: hypothetical protein LBE01_00885, partial [Deltaproteobacteria bacterium]|nr:hypothetical protein [Deltaproteobacteria bacterium]